jgi:hypothetical protein
MTKDENDLVEHRKNMKHLITSILYHVAVSKQDQSMTIGKWHTNQVKNCFGMQPLQNLLTCSLVCRGERGKAGGGDG